MQKNTDEIFFIERKIIISVNKGNSQEMEYIYISDYFVEKRNCLYFTIYNMGNNGKNGECE